MEVIGGAAVRVSFTGDPEVHDAKIVVPGYTSPRVGDSVLVLTDEQGLTWILGLLPRSALDEALDDAPARRNVVHDRRGRILFEYEPEHDRAVLHIPTGDLEILAPDGMIRMRSGVGISLETAGDLSLRSDRRVDVVAAPERSSARLSMHAGQVTIAGAVVAALADRAELLASEVGLEARHVETRVERLRTVAKVIDVRAGRVVERARDVYREVSGLSQTRAGRVRLVAKKTAQLVAENTLLKARDRMKVKGERIHLA